MNNQRKTFMAVVLAGVHCFASSQASSANSATNVDATTTSSSQRCVNPAAPITADRQAEFDRLQAEARRLRLDLQTALESMKTLPPPTKQESKTITAQRKKRDEIVHLLADIDRKFALDDRTLYVPSEADGKPACDYYWRLKNRVEAASGDMPSLEKSGEAYVQFTVDFNGGIKNLKIIRSTDDRMKIWVTKLLHNLEPFERFPEEMRATTDDIVISNTFTYTKSN